MPARTFKLLQDIRDAAAFVQQVTVGRTLEEYQAERLLRQAVERNFEIIGEAMRRLTKEDAETSQRITHSRQIIAFRNILSHGYDIIDDAAVWRVIANDLRKLELEVTALIEEVVKTDEEGD